MSRIYWDTMLFIYWLEGHPTYVDRLRQILTRMEARGDQLCSSAFGVGELLAGAMRRGDRELADAIRQAMQPPHVELLPFDARTAEHFGEIRARCRTSPADSIHLACAAAGPAWISS